jgi:lipopolysaccharide/colanic/teichoic acid biosynthesis glycosyltransferase
MHPRKRGFLVVCLGRVLEMLVSLTMLLILAPVMLTLALLIKRDSAGPALYRQERLGLQGKPFTLLKFRSMRMDAETNGPAWASVGDPRITRIGKILRLTRLDELPQLWNVLRGDMALIGPRPERAHFTDELAAHIPHFRSRLLVKPGLTGWAQVNLPYGASIEDARIKLAYDLYYVQHQGVRMTVLILFRTVRVMVCMAGR